MLLPRRASGQQIGHVFSGRGPLLGVPGRGTDHNRLYNPPAAGGQQERAADLAELPAAPAAPERSSAVARRTWRASDNRSATWTLHPVSIVWTFGRTQETSRGSTAPREAVLQARRKLDRPATEDSGLSGCASELAARPGGLSAPASGFNEPPGGPGFPASGFSGPPDRLAFLASGINGPPGGLVFFVSGITRPPGGLRFFASRISGTPGSLAFLTSGITRPPTTGGLQGTEVAPVAVPEAL